MSMQCPPPLVRSPEKHQFQYPPQAPNVHGVVDSSEQDVSESDCIYDETETSTGVSGIRQEAEDKYNMMTTRGSDEVQVFEDGEDDDSDEVVDHRTMEMHHQQQRYLSEQLIEHYRIDEDTSSLTEERVSTAVSSSTVELITVERWTVSGDSYSQPATLKITSGTKFSERQMQMRHSQSHQSAETSTMSVTSETNNTLHPIAQVPVFSARDMQQRSKQSPHHSSWADSTNPGIQSAGRLVHEIYNQIMFHDSPAVNETKALQELEQPSLMEEVEVKQPSVGHNKVSTQRHDATSPMVVKSASSGLYSFDTEETTSNLSKELEIHRLGAPLKGQYERYDQSHVHSFFRHLQKQPESKMGHIALGTLCSWTLDVIQPVPTLTVETRPVSTPTYRHALEVRTPTSSLAERNTPTHTRANNTTSTTPKGGGVSKEKSGKWKLKSYFKKKKKPSSGTSAEVVVRDHFPRVPNAISELTPNTGLPTQPGSSTRKVGACTSTLSVSVEWGEENVIEDRWDGSTPRPRPGDSSLRYPEAGMSPKGAFPAASTRLQMFGSEYARYLSNSALAPRIRSPRLPQKSASSRYGPFTTRRRNPNSNISAGIQQIMSASSFGSIRSKSKNTNTSWNLEDQENAILTGAIVDICITNGSDTPPPKGYYRISQTVDGEEFKGALRAGGGTGAGGSPRKKSSTYLNVKKEPNWHRAAQRPCVTALTIIFPDRQEFVPPGFCVVREHRRCHVPYNQTKQSGGNNTADGTNNAGAQETDSTVKDQPANFNAGEADGERIFLCFRRSREGNPLTGILPLQPVFNEAIPDGFTVLERSPRNFVANLNPKSSSPVFLAYRQRLANLEPLRPLPLLLSVPATSNDEENSQMSVGSARSRGSGRNNSKPKLSAYYCTGGTVVEANVGRYHIMDRSTHDLLSPSSVANRLSLIELSRRKTLPKLAGEYEAIPPSNVQRARDNANNSNTPARGLNKGYTAPVRLPTETIPSSQDSAVSSKFVVGGRAGNKTNMSMHSSIAEYPRTSNASFSSKDSMSIGTDDDSDAPAVILSSFPSSNQHSGGYYPKLYDPHLQANHDALNFIPVVEIATHPSLIEPQRHLRARTALLTPILTACYQRHGGAALKAVEGLNRLLIETDFFADDFDVSSKRASIRLTLLDITVQVVCDVATGGAQETTFGTCVEFVENAIKCTRGHMNTRTMGYVLRFYLFVFYFGASVPANNANAFPHASWAPGIGLDETDHITLPILYDPRVEERMSYLPGGAPQQAALAFKDLITYTISRLQRVCLTVPHFGMVSNSGEGIEMETTSKFINGIISSLVDGAVHRVDVANFTQMAIHQIHRSGGSELFWHDMITSCGIGLFGQHELPEEVQNLFVLTFALLANLVKVAAGKIRTNAVTYELRARDVSSKILSLELLLHFLQRYRDEQQVWIDSERPLHAKLARCVETMVFAVRRLIVPCILSSTRAGLEEPRVFSRVMQIMSLLWRTPMYRDRMKGEMGILIEHFALRTLRLGPQLQQSRQMNRRQTDADDLSCPLLSQQTDVLTEIKRWFTVDPKATIEMYLNYDTDITSQVAGPMPLLPGTQWKVFQRICAGLCNLAEQCGDLIGEQIRQSQSTATHAEAVKSKIPGFMDATNEGQAVENKEARLAEMKAIREGARRLRKAALDAIVQILKCLARTSAVATGKQFYELVASWSDPNNPDDYFHEIQTVPSSGSEESHQSDSEFSDDDSDDNRLSGPGGVLGFWRKEIASKSKPFAYNFETQPGLLSSVTRETAFEIAKKKSVKKSVEYLIACNALTSSPKDIASFLRVHKDRLDQGALGQYLGETGVDGQETEYWNLIRFSYVRAISFDGMKVEDALRHFLTNCGFQLPGEAQKVDRIMSTFAQCYWEDNAGDIKICPFQDQDTVFLLSFAIIMLNTDLHKSGGAPSSRTNSKSARRHITKQEFLRNLSGVEGGEELKRDYLSAVYDSIQSNPIVLTSDESSETQTHAHSVEDRERMLKGMIGNVRSADALLRGLSVHDVKWASMQDFSSSLDYEGADALSDLTQSCISEAWHQFHGVINTALETAHLDPQGMEPCVDLLKYALVVTICLDMPMERSAFLSQLGRFKVFEGNRTSNPGNWVPDAEQGRLLLLKGNPAFDRAIAGPLDEESKLKALVQVHEATQHLRSALKVDIEAKQEMSRITHQILDGEFLLNDPSRTFVRMGDLKKKSIRSGRYTDYRFFLFSDVLIYAKRSSASYAHQRGSFYDNVDKDHNKDEYKIHEELPLHLMKVIDWFPPSSIKDVMKKAFQVHHPRKTFMVFCNSPEERIAWVRDIRLAIEKEIKRKVEMEAARMAAATMSAPPTNLDVTPRLI
ncbi:inhibited guanine nucleotide-exchange protein [Seminavis robusta]|uniref:Inhibited guanine nucleotide-exchange protein n=1 Tax=Seminavis robusta TaxID=568900 RepID=A0A9N8HT80_9STRA|nr:inhibited guanine nucleotide-exchange protein [Seminavis robusta]|eukprot:Sro1479_g276100.1 inhibited guanine nucleotide-exchange protein (2349) ;mRNA; f:19315-26524